MNKLIDIKSENGKLVVSSRQIAEDFNKGHSSMVIRAIENLIKDVERSGQNCTHLFIKTEYQNEQNGQWYKEYLLTRDGFSLLVMGFTGAKALEWKLKYIQAFNRIEEQLVEPKPTCIEDLIILQAQSLKDIKQQLNQVNHSVLRASAKAEETKEEVQAMRDIITLNPNSWRKDSSALINKMALNAGGYEHIRVVREESYKLLNTRLGVDIKTRLTNKRRRMADEGICKSKRDKLNPLDVIADDKKLIEGYLAIVKEMSIKYKA